MFPLGIDLRRIRAFVVAAETRSHELAAEQLVVTRQAVQKSILSLEVEVFDDEKLLTRSVHGLEPTALGARVLPAARNLLIDAAKLATIRADPVSHTTVGFLPHHAEFMTTLLSDVRDLKDLEIATEVLEERHREQETFQAEVIDRLRRRHYDVVIGPPPDENRRAGLTWELLYETHLVALVPGTHAPEFRLDDEDAAELLLPPDSTRAGLTIRNALRDAGSPDWEFRVRQVSFGTKVLVIFAVADLGVAITPGDIAFVFSPGGTLGGSAGVQAGHQWVPVIDRNGKLLTHEVFATTLSSTPFPDDRVARTVKLLRAAVKDRYEEAAGDLISLPSRRRSHGSPGPARRRRKT
jgi:DNA-binding transcriptional LysR family regulator